MKVPLIHSTFHYVNLRMFPSLLFPQGLVIIYVQANRNLVDQASQPFHGHMLLEAILEIIHMQLSYQQVEAHANASYDQSLLPSTGSSNNEVCPSFFATVNGIPHLLSHILQILGCCRCTLSKIIISCRNSVKLQLTHRD
ncbi:uncharacterized protein LOC114425105 isoform X1 [Glycine soja]|uniref:uncharacterized protein isoform X1 n=1 Tax=Glycine max TaxID=3847 RepID=UPI0003DE826F|nr:uncharacterized protein LOC102667270 isoform X1 [Glycine max]XP_028247673.1 uncharacterized protein LOC114425105 isoform X1 [Glycine soja]|eukprot:XP_006573792.1 uncharacterized protein LOC102667270 isoform X2 [Glycine max]